MNADDIDRRNAPDTVQSDEAIDNLAGALKARGQDRGGKAW